MKIKKFEDIKAWQEARILTKMIYQSIQNNRDFRQNYKFKEQIVSASVSIMSNIAEGFSRRTNKEFVQFLFIAKGSCSEVQSQLYVALDHGYLSENKFRELYAKAEEIAKILSGFISYLLG